MILDEQTLKRVRDMGALGHTPSQIVSLLDISRSDRAIFYDELTNPETPLYIAYNKGRSIMSYNTNVELARLAEKGDQEAIVLLDERSRQQRVDELLLELFRI